MSVSVNNLFEASVMIFSKSMTHAPFPHHKSRGPHLDELLLSTGHSLAERDLAQNYSIRENWREL
jgi:hypothetical protein